VLVDLLCREALCGERCALLFNTHLLLCHVNMIIEYWVDGKLGMVVQRRVLGAVMDEGVD